MAMGLLMPALTYSFTGQASEPGVQLHRLTDLTMLRYAIILDLPGSQIMEMIDHLGQPGHSGFSVEELQGFMNTPAATGTQIWPPNAAIEKSFTMALRDSVRALLATRPITSVEGFRSGKLLTAYDQREQELLAYGEAVRRPRLLALKRDSLVRHMVIDVLAGPRHNEWRIRFIARTATFGPAILVSENGRRLPGKGLAAAAVKMSAGPAAGRPLWEPAAARYSGFP
jgi:hypothetical protein